MPKLGSKDNSEYLKNGDINMYKTLPVIAGLVLILCCASAFAARENIASATMAGNLRLDNNPTTRTGNLLLPDLAVKSAQVTGIPFTYNDIVIIPLSITITNKGATNPSGDFNVGARGEAIDGNAYGYDFIVPGEAIMEGRGGILCHGFVAPEKTYQGYLFLKANPISAPFQPGTKYRIHAMVDYNLDPDAGYSTWGIADRDRSNNDLVINYP